MSFNDPSGLLPLDPGAGLPRSGENEGGGYSGGYWDDWYKDFQSGPGEGINLYGGGKVAMGPRRYWTSGWWYPDWSLSGGSQMYLDAMAAGGIQIGSKQVYFSPRDGERKDFVVKGGQVGYYVDNNSS